MIKRGGACRGYRSVACGSSRNRKRAPLGRPGRSSHRRVERPAPRVERQRVEPAVEHRRGKVVQRVEQHPHTRTDRVLRRDPAPPLPGRGGEGGEQPVEVGAFVVVQALYTRDGFPTNVGLTDHTVDITTTGGDFAVPDIVAVPADSSRSLWRGQPGSGRRGRHEGTGYLPAAPATRVRPGRR